MVSVYYARKMQTHHRSLLALVRVTLASKRQQWPGHVKYARPDRMGSVGPPEYPRFATIVSRASINITREGQHVVTALQMQGLLRNVLDAAAILGILHSTRFKTLM